jgi:hypothetical protein
VNTNVRRNLLCGMYRTLDPFKGIYGVKDGRDVNLLLQNQFCANIGICESYFSVHDFLSSCDWSSSVYFGADLKTPVIHLLFGGCGAHVDGNTKLTGRQMFH